MALRRKYIPNNDLTTIRNLESTCLKERLGIRKKKYLIKRDLLSNACLKKN